MNYFLNTIHFNLYFNPYKEMRKKGFEIESYLSNRFSLPIQINPVPDEAPPEIPRIIANSVSNMSKLLFSQSNLSFVIQFEEDKQYDFHLVYKFLNEDIKDFYQIINKLGITNLLYTGILIDFFFPFESLEKTFEIFRKNYFGNKIDHPYDLKIKTTFVHKNKYFINYSLKSLRKYKQDTSLGQRISPSYLGNHQTGIQLTIDMNDRFAYNTQPEYFSDFEEGILILDYLKFIIFNKLNDVILHGEFPYEN